MFFLAESSAFLIASGMPRALPSPTPTLPLLSPTTTMIDHDAVLPPLWVLNTLLDRMTRTSSCGPSCGGPPRPCPVGCLRPINLGPLAILELQPAFSGSVG